MFVLNSARRLQFSSVSGLPTCNAVVITRANNNSFSRKKKINRVYWYRIRCYLYQKCSRLFHKYTYRKKKPVHSHFKIGHQKFGRCLKPSRYSIVSCKRYDSLQFPLTLKSVRLDYEYYMVVAYRFSIGYSEIDDIIAF